MSRSPLAAKLAICRNVILTISVSLIMLSVALNVLGGTVLHLYEPVVSSDFEARNYHHFPKPSVKALASGSFQSNFEMFASDRVPLRNEIVMYNATLQREAITLAGAPYGFGALPAYYGSDRVIFPELDAVYRFPQRRGDFKLKTYLSQLETALANYCEGREDIEWRIALPDSSELSLANPAHDLVSNTLDYLDLRSEITSILPPAFHFVDVHYDDTATYLEDFFKTDHHWQIQGGARCYEEVIKSLGRTPIDLPEPYLAYEGPFFGSNARSARTDLYSDVIYDIDHAHSHLTITAKGKRQKLSYIDQQYLEDGEEFTQESRFQSLHGAWFHGQIPLIHFLNEDLPASAGTLVIIADSYSNNNGRFYAENYRNVYEIDPRFFEGSIIDYIDEHDADAVLILLSQDSLRTEGIRKALK